MYTASDIFPVDNSSFCGTIGVIQKKLRQDMEKISKPMHRKVIIAQSLNPKNIEIASYYFNSLNPNLAQL